MASGSGSGSGFFTSIACLVTLAFTAVSIYSITVIVDCHRTMVHSHRVPEISLANFSVSNLNIVHEEISGDWTIGLNLKNPSGKTAVFSDIELTVVLSAARDVPILELHQGYPFVLQPESQTGIYRTGSVEGLRLSHMTAGSMAQDVIDGESVEFDLLVRAKARKEDLVGSVRLELTCNGIKVLISPENSAPVNATGSATEIPVCGLVQRRVKYDI